MGTMVAVGCGRAGGCGTRSIDAPHAAMASTMPTANRIATVAAPVRTLPLGDPTHRADSPMAHA